MEIDKISTKGRAVSLSFRSLALSVMFIFVVVFSPALSPASGPGGLPTKRIIVYYFHGDYRCPTCLKLEKLSRVAVEENFKKEFSSGLLKYLSVNVDRPENRHFVDDFGLFTKSLVVVEEDGGKVKRYKNLQKIWVLVRDEAAFKNYVKDEVKGFIHGSKGSEGGSSPPSGK